MARHSNATARSETPHLNVDIKQRAQSLIDDKSRNAGTRSILRYALAIDDLSLADLVRRVDAGKSLLDDRGFLQIEEAESVQ